MSATISSSTNVSCKGGNNGFASGQFSGGTPPYTLLWTGGSSGTSATNLTSGLYFFSVTDGNGCNAADSVFISEPVTALSVTTTFTPVICKTDSNGTATITPLGGISPYNYQWDISANGQTDSTATGLIAGTYNVTVEDFNNCTFLTSAMVSEPVTSLILDTSSTFVICNGEGNGTATVKANGGNSPYTYLWDINANAQSDSTATGLFSGTYFVSVTDNNGCLKTVSAFVDQPLSPLTVVFTSDSANCFGAADGKAGIIPSGGTSPYSYLWDDPIGQTDSIATGLAAGFYNVTVTDNTGSCKVIESIFVNQPNSIIPNPAFSNVKCFGGNDGSALVAPTGGTPPYSFFWNNNFTSSAISNLMAQTYSVTISDSKNCNDSVLINISQPLGPLSISSLVKTDVSCNGDNDGDATVIVSGGTGNFSYLWNNPGQSTTSTVTGLSAGSYSVSISDSNNCSVDTSVFIAEPSPGLTVMVLANDVNCFGGNDGTASVTPAGGTSPYFYLWDANAGSQTDSTATGLPSGTYSVTVTDDNGCVLDTNSAVIVGQPATFISVFISQLNVFCFGDSTGTGMLSVSGGTSPYSYLWDANAGFQTDSSATGLTAGTYFATVTDNNGCADDSLTVVISEPPELITNDFFTNVICKGESNGTASVSPSGGTSPYNFQWDPGANNQTDSIATGLKAGTYLVTCTDFSGCTLIRQFIISEADDSLFLTSTFSDVICKGDSNGTAQIIPTGGIPPYYFQWDGGTGFQTGPSATGLKAGTYSVIVNDSSGCTDSISSVIISEPASVMVSASADDTICKGENSIINATGTGGTGSYIYIWNVGTGANQNVSPLVNSLYTVTVIDSNNCQSPADSVVIFVRNYYPDSIEFSCGSFSNCILCPGDSTQISAKYYEEFPPYSYQWIGLGNGLGPFTVAPSITTIYIFEVSDICGSFTDTFTINVDSFPMIQIDSFLYDGCAPLQVAFKNSFQNPPGTGYFWNFGDGTTSQEEEPVHLYENEGSYKVFLSLTSPNNCVKSADSIAMVEVRQIPKPECSANPLTGTLQNPTIHFGTGNYSSWVWEFDDGDSSLIQNPDHTFKDSGDYYVKVKVVNQYNCFNACSILVRINPIYPLGIPSAFSPNPSGSNGGRYSLDDFTNNIFFPITKYTKDYHLEIFNRWGELIFESFDIGIGWDGYYQGVLCQQDVYVWKIYIKWWDDQEFNNVGDVTLLR